MAHVFEGQPDGRQADTVIEVSRFRPKYRALSNEEKSLHDAIKDEAAVLECNWFVRQRQEWIAETVRVFGFINREHIQIKFGISTPQASYDLTQFQ